MDELLPDFFHGGSFELVRMTFFSRRQADARTAPELLGALGRDVDEQKPALNEGRRIDRFVRGGIVLRI
jgi:hypothetical protein